MIQQTFKRLTQILLAVAVMLVAFGAPSASAATFYGTYSNPAGGTGGNYTFVDCGNCPDDQAVTVASYNDGYHVRVRMQAEVSGTYYTYLDKILQNNYSGKWKITGLPKGKVRLMLCFYDSGWNYIGGCNYHYGNHSN